MATATPSTAIRPMTTEERKVIFASSLGTVFEWYDFYLYGSLAAIIAKQFFAGLDPTSAFIFALLAFAAGFIIRPFGALVFGRLGDMIGRKYTFLVTILIMGISTFIVGVLPNYASIGVAAPVILICLRLLQGLALGGEYGGAATYVAEHAPHGKRGAYTSWIQTTATLGLFLSLLVILGTRTIMGEPAFNDWAFNLPRGEPLREKWALIPAGTDVLVTHGPPRGHGDRVAFGGEHVGCEDLLSAVERLAPRLHVFGHIHEGAGVTRNAATTFVNAASCDLFYEPTQPPILFDLIP